MKRFTALWLVLLALIPSAFAATITGNLVDLTGSTADTKLTFTSRNAPGASGVSVVVPTSKRVQTSGGTFSITLLQGNYQVTSDLLNGYISVPAGDDTINIKDIFARLVSFLSTNDIAVALGVTMQEVGYLSGVTNGIQTQINALAAGGGGGSSNALTAITGEVIATGPGSAASVIATNAVTTVKIAANAVVGTNIASGAVGTDQIAINAVTTAKIPASAVVSTNIAAGAVDTDRIALQAVTPERLNDTSRFDAGQFLGDPSTQDIKIQPAVANASGGSITFSWAEGQPTVLETTNSVDLTVTIADVPALTGRTKSWRLRVFSPDGTKTLTFAGAPLVLGSGTFINPPPSGINDYLFERVGSTNYYHVLRPGFSATKRVWGRNSPGAGDVEEPDINQILDWLAGTPADGDMIYRSGTNWTLLPKGTAGEFLQMISGAPGWGTGPTASGFDFSVTGLSTNATPSYLFTNSIAENTTVSLQAKVTGAGAGGATTNRAYFDVAALVSRDAGGSATFVGTNDSTIIPAVPDSSAYWTLSGNDALLQVIGLTNNYYTWNARGWYQVTPNGTNTYSPFTAGFDGSNDYLNVNSVPSGLTDGSAFTLAFWMDLTGGDAADKWVIAMRSGSNNRLFLRRTTTNTFQFGGQDSTTTSILSGIGSGTYTASSPSGWTHFLLAVNLATPETHLYTNGVEDASITLATQTSSGVFDFSMASPSFFLGAGSTSAPLRIQASFADFWFNDSFVNDPSKFISSGGRPVNLGTDGSTVTGSAPVLYFSGGGSGNSWTNTATATQFTITGSLDSPSPP